MNTATVVDTEAVLGGLKEFQRNTVDYVFHRFYEAEKPTHRFLVADEVGLGKTLVARGLIARAIEHLKIEHRKRGVEERIDIVYVCSNADIARQNVNRLNVTGRRDFNFPTRITLLPIYLHGLKKNDVNFVSFTPGTSFDLKSQAGLVQERALLYWLLKHTWGWPDSRDDGVLQLLHAPANLDRFRDPWVKHWTPRVIGTGSFEIDPDLADAFSRKLEDEESHSQLRGTTSLRERFADLSDRYSDSDYHDWEGRQRLIGSLRQTLAHSCVQALEPDLIILDEFQRFAQLLDRESEAAELARELFSQDRARVLLLSATPYKMNTLPEEMSAGDDHYAEFRRTTRFLMDDDDVNAAGLATDLKSFRDGLLSLRAESDLQAVRTRRRRVEHRLRQVMCRTERLAIEGEQSAMLVDRPTESLRIEPADLRTYVLTDRVSRMLRSPDSLEYWKSAPYLFNFMETYKVKRQFHDALKLEAERSRLAEYFSPGDALLPVEEIERGYPPIDAGNARMRWLMESMSALKTWRLLWLPPALPYYELGSAFGDALRGGFTKRLVFSAWSVVPQAISILLSYEAERQMMHEGGLTTPEERRRLGALLRFQRQSEGERNPGGMALLALMYPSTVLAELADPLRMARGMGGRRADTLPSVEQLQQRAEQLIARKLRPILKGHNQGPVDEAWYWAAPLLLDGADAETWLSGVVGQQQPEQRRAALEKLWRTEQEKPGELVDAGPEQVIESGVFTGAIEAARRVLSDPSTLRRPPGDLAATLARLALAGPAVCALRALARVAGGPELITDEALRDGAARAAWGFRSLFNIPEVTAMVRGPGQEDYWKSVLKYCLDGGLQAVLDEYAHVLRESLGILESDTVKIGDELGTAIHDSVAVRAATYGVEDIRLDGPRHLTATTKRLRARYALRYGDQAPEIGGDPQRASRVRNAFNSPFWPFVLASTSVGQEGLDFHQYCHAVVHWNLPANPVDLEQREGRVHRYKGHAIRKNVASKNRAAAFKTAGSDPWADMFREASKGPLKAQGGGLIPFWVYTDGPARIERYVPSLPLSREVEKLQDLKRSLAVYRLAFGQPRQDDLNAYLIGLPTALREQVCHECLIDLTPKPTRPQTHSLHRRSFP